MTFDEKTKRQVLEKLIELINSEISEERKYHDHKENVVWASVTLFWSVIIGTIILKAPCISDLWILIGLTKAICLIGFILAVFVGAQLWSRRESHVKIEKLEGQRSTYLKKLAAIAHTGYLDPNKPGEPWGLYLAGSAVMALMILGSIFAIIFVWSSASNLC